MPVKYILKKETYFDSVTLMLINGEVSRLEGVEKALVGMGTDYNIDSLKRLDISLPELKNAGPNDLIICVKARSDESAAEAVKKAETLLTKRTVSRSGAKETLPATLQGALKLLPDADIATISVPGNYAAREADLALEKGLHVMLFSDNVPIDDEISLKKKATAKNLLLMGPDCGTAIINNIPLCFANAVRKGDIGLVAASGTGLQEVTSIIHRLGLGITQAIGVGGRDLTEKVSGLMTRFAVKALANDPATKVLVILSKPPAKSTTEILFDELKYVSKPVIIYFIGADPKQITDAGFIAAENLEDAAIKACERSCGKKIQGLVDHSEISEKAGRVKLTGRYTRGLYSGGTLCDEAQRLLQPILGDISSNTPIHGCQKMKDVYSSKGHTIIDLGDDEFTRGKAHPMIDSTYRRERLELEAAQKDVGLIFFDVVLGYGSHPDMAGEMVAAIERARKAVAVTPLFAATLCGTDLDMQNYAQQWKKLEDAGVIVFPSNVSLVSFIRECFRKDQN